MDKICLRVDNVKRTQNEQIFPEYDCLVLSPANLWGQNIQNFSGDINILNTIFQYHVSKIIFVFVLKFKNMAFIEICPDRKQSDHCILFDLLE